MVLWKERKHTSQHLDPKVEAKGYTITDTLMSLTTNIQEGLPESYFLHTFLQAQLASANKNMATE